MAAAAAAAAATAAAGCGGGDARLATPAHLPVDCPGFRGGGCCAGGISAVLRPRALTPLNPPCRAGLYVLTRPRAPLTCAGLQATQFTADLGVTKKTVSLGFTKSNELVSRLLLLPPRCRALAGWLAGCAT